LERNPVFFYRAAGSNLTPSEKEQAYNTISTGWLAISKSNFADEAIFPKTEG
jgi:hypothetical protein